MKKFIFEKTTLKKVNELFEMANGSSIVKRNKQFSLMRVIKEENEHVLSFDEIIMLKDEHGRVLSVMTFNAFDRYRKKLLYTPFYDKDGRVYKFFQKIDFEKL